MATIQLHASSSKQKLHSLKIDMTPMVDLGFLLITFFIFTTSMSEPKITRLIMPANGEPNPVKESKTLTALLDNDKVYLYKGKWDDALRSRTIVRTSYDVKEGFGNFIRKKQTELAAKGEKEDLVFIIKPLPSSSYQNVIAALDEVQINNINYYAVADVTADEKAFVKKER